VFEVISKIDLGKIYFMKIVAVNIKYLFQIYLVLLEDCC